MEKTFKLGNLARLSCYLHEIRKKSNFDHILMNKRQKCPPFVNEGSRPFSGSSLKTYYHDSTINGKSQISWN